MPHRRSVGFTLIELLIIVAILGIIIAIAVINYRNAIERARQRRTMSDLRNLASAAETYAADFDRYPPPAGFTLPPGLTLPTGTLETARPYLDPTYLRTFPVADGWNSWFLYGTSEAGTDYVACSSGKEGVPETAPAYGPTTELTSDIILVNGQFVQWPDGAQR